MIKWSNLSWHILTYQKHPTSWQKNKQAVFKRRVLNVYKHHYPCAYIHTYTYICIIHIYIYSIYTYIWKYPLLHVKWSLPHDVHGANCFLISRQDLVFFRLVLLVHPRGGVGSICQRVHRRLWANLIVHDVYGHERDQQGLKCQFRDCPDRFRWSDSVSDMECTPLQRFFKVECQECHPMAPCFIGAWGILGSDRNSWGNRGTLSNTDPQKK